MTIKVSDQGRQFIRDREGFEPKAKRDLKTNQLVVGHGVKTNDPNEVADEGKARQMQEDYVNNIVEPELNNVQWKRNFTQDQQDVLGDFHYNATSDARGSMYAFINSGATDTEIQAKFMEYSMSENSETKQKEFVQGLANRNKMRGDVWMRGGAAVPQDPRIEDPAFKAELAPDDMLEGFEPQEAAPKYDMLDGMDPEQELASPSPESMLDFAADSIGEEASAEVLRIQEAKRLAANINIDFDDAYAQLYTSSAKEIIARHAHGVTAKYFPANTAWMQKDDANYVMARETGNFTRKVEAQTVPLKTKHKGDWNKVLGTNMVMGKDAVNELGRVLGVIDHNTYKQNLKDLDVEKQANQLDSIGARKFGALTSKKDVSLADLGREFLKNPSDAVKMSLQSQGSTVATIIMGAMGGAAGTLAGGQAGAMLGSVPGAVVGMTLGGLTGSFLSAASVSLVLEYKEYMNGELEPFRNKETGVLDVDAAYSDPKRVNKWRSEAKVRGITIGVIDGVTSMIGGKVGTAVAKGVFKAPAKTALGKVARAATKVTASSTFKAGEEGVGEFAGSLTPKLYSNGSVTKEDVKKAYNEAKVEAAFALIPGTATTVITHALSPVKQAEKIIIKRAQAADKANAAGVNVAAIRATVNAEPSIKENREQVKDLINESVMPEVAQDTNQEVEDLDVPESATDSAVSRMKKESMEGLVEVSPSEWNALHEELGLDPLEAISKLGPEVRAAYAANMESDSSITIPLSEWATYSPEELDEKADAIVRVGGNNLNARDAQEDIEALTEDPKVLMSPFLPTPILEGEVDLDSPPAFNDILIDESTMEIIEATGAEGNVVMRPIELLMKGKTEEEQAIYHRLLSTLKQATKESKGVDPASLDIVAEIQINHMRHRASMLGVSLNDLMGKLKFGLQKSNEFAGAYAPSKYAGGIAKVLFNRHSTAPVIVHELGHSWLHEMAEDYEHINMIPEEALTPAQREYKGAMNVAADHLGMDNMGDLLTLWNRLVDSGFKDSDAHAEMSKIHETFAQTTEVYFLQGKFASSKIQSLMNTFRKWMLPYLETIGKVYPHFPALKITPEVERMFDAILGASQAAEDTVIPMFGAPLFDQAILGKDGAKYMETVDEAIAQAIGETYTAIVLKNYKDREKAITKNLNETYAQATKNIDEKDSSKLSAFIKGNYDSYKKGDGTSDPRFSIESVATMFFDGDMAKALEFKKTLPQHMITGQKKGGLDVAQFMLMNEITDKAGLLGMITETGKRDQMIEAEQSRLIDESFPILKTDDEIHQIAVEKMNMDGKEKLLLKEMKILATKFLPTLKGLAEKAINPASYVANTSKKVIQAKAMTQILNSFVSHFGAAKFLRDSERQGREASKKFKAGDMQGAFDSKYLQARNFFAYKIAQRAERLIGKTNEQIRKIEKFTATKLTAKAYDIEVVNFAKVIIQSVKAGVAIPLLTRDMVSPQSPISPSQIDSINEKVQMFAENNGTGKFKDFKVDTHLQLGDILAFIAVTAKKIRLVEINGVIKFTDDVANEISLEIGTDGNVVEYQGEGKMIAARVSKMNTRSLMKTLYSDDVAFAKSTYAQLDAAVVDAEAKRTLHFEQAEGRIEAALSKTIKKDPFLKRLYAPILRRPYEFFGGTWERPIISGEDELNINFVNKAELQTAMLIALGSESGARKFLEGNCGMRAGIDGTMDVSRLWKMVHRMTKDGTLTKEDFEFYQVVWDEFAAIHPMIEDAMRTVDGYEIGEIDALPFTTEFGEHKGGYFPVAQIKEMMSPSQRNAAWGVSHETNGISAHDLHPSRRTGMTEKRTEQIYKIDLNLKNASRYLSTSLNIAYLRKPLATYEKVLKHSKVTNILDTRRPGAIDNVIIPQFERTKNQIYTEYSTDLLGNVSRDARHAVNQIMYLFNFASALKQYLGLGQGMAKIGGHKIAQALVLNASEPKKSREFIAEKSTFMAERFSRSIRSTARSIEQLNVNFDWINWSQDRIEFLTYIFSQIAQNMVDSAMWRAAYAKGLDSDMTEEQAIFYANDMVSTTQSSSAVSFMPNLLAGGDFKKLLTQVMSVPTAISQTSSIEMQRDQTTYNRSVGISKIALFSIMLPIIIQIELSGDAEEDEDKTPNQKHKKKMLAYAAQSAAGGLDMVFPGISRLYSGNMGPVFGTIYKTPKVISTIGKKLDGVDMTDKQYINLLNALALYTGQNLFTLAGKAQKGMSAIKSEDEKSKESYTRKYQLRELRFEE